jgi:MHS family shikimate/dehydroshikimate transporter-like MFS transporter
VAKADLSTDLSAEALAKAEASAEVDAAAVRRVMLASFVGTTIEWYDFFLYGTAAALVFGRLFFPTAEPLVGTLSAFATFAVGFVARPLGGIVFGHFGDRVGRKSMLVYSLLIMGVATFLIGVLPTYDTLGIGAAVLLVILRCFQGIGVGGEWGGAVLMAVEHAHPGRRGLAGSWPQMGVPAGLFLSTVVFALLNRSLSEEQFLAWGWRVPFLASLILIAVGVFVRLTVLESPAFARLQERGAREARPIVAAIRDYRRSILLAVGMRAGENGIFYIYTVFVLSYGPAELGLSRTTMLAGVAVGALVALGTIPLCGWLSDRIGRRPLYLFGAAFSLLYAFPFFALLDFRSTGMAWLAITLGLAVGHAAMYGPQASYFSELFGAAVRYSGASLSYQLASVLFGAMAPFIATFLLAAGGARAVAAYMMVLAAISVAAVIAAPETHHRELAT